MSADKIVVWDPKGDYWEGSLVDAQTASILESRGAAILPVSTQLFKRSGCGGFFKRAWGAGWPLDYSAPKLVCPLSLFVTQDLRKLHWAIRLVPDPGNLAAAREGKNFTEGRFHVVGDSNQVHTHLTSVTPAGKAHDARDLGKCDENDGWTLIGSGTIHPPYDGHYGFGIYGTMPGARVAWAALSLTS